VTVTTVLCDLCPSTLPIPAGQSRRLHIGDGKTPAHSWDLCPECYAKLLTHMNAKEPSCLTPT